MSSEPAKRPIAPGGFVVGVDPASCVDFFAAVVDEPEGSGREMIHFVRHIERTRGLSYPLLVEKLRILEQRLRGAVKMAVDATGLGGPVMDYLREADLKARIFSVTFTAGHETRREASASGAGLAYFVPKRELVSCLGLALETNRVRLSKSMRHGDVLQRELEGFTQTLTAAGHDSYGAASGQHDDLVSALSLAVWLAEKEGPGGGWASFESEDPDLSRAGQLRRYS